MILVKAMTAGVSIIANRVGAILEVGQSGRTARLVASKFAPAHEILTLAGYVALRDQLVLIGRRRHEGFSWQQSVDVISRQYDRITTVDH